MNLGPALIPEFDQEMGNTRKVLERIPADKLDWKAHPRLNTIRWVGTHIAHIPGWTTFTLSTECLDLSPPGGSAYQEPLANSVDEMLEKFDQHVTSARSALQTASDETLLRPWTLLNAGISIFTLPRLAVIRSFVLNHLIHHRAHLCVYLRMNGVAVPGMYGPSGDEGT
ncbi:MAG: hypothetical protein KatS3mg113_0579 [Planctomycetaceae bacterium]|nr:MAG: hypothetical protein KatS3mg113_0579 [Planctomycetaceae bacterium]